MKRKVFADIKIPKYGIATHQMSNKMKCLTFGKAQKRTFMTLCHLKCKRKYMWMYTDIKNDPYMLILQNVHVKNVRWQYDGCVGLMR